MHRRRILTALAALAARPAARALATPAGVGFSASTPEPTTRTADAVDFDAVLPERRIAFPEDHGAHPGYRTEWWYATGWLKRPDGGALGFQCTFFRVRTGIGEANPSAFAPRQLLFAHAAIADPALNRLRHDQRAARVGLGRAGFTTGRCAVWIGDWRLAQHDNTYRMQVAGADFAYALTLSTDAPPLLNGDAGFSTKSSDARHASYYYSRPQLAVHGTVTLAGHGEAVTGRAWLDHEWSSELLPAAAQGWDWVGINFDDGSALMAFRLRRADPAGAANATNTSPPTPLWSAATWQDADGRRRNLPPEAIEFTAQRTWKSPRTGVAYPVEWRVRAGEFTLHLTPLFDDQELDSRASTGAIYWEGAVRALAGGREVGRGYLELTGYAGRLRVG